jgi:hypothetical protein
MALGEKICREALTGPVPNEDVAALLYQSLHGFYGIRRQSTPLPPAMALVAIKNDGVDAAVLQAHSATDPDVLAKLMRDARVAVKEALATNDALAPGDYQRLWTYAFEGLRAEMVNHLSHRIDLAWVLTQNLGGNWTSQNIWNIIAQRVIDSGDQGLLVAAITQAHARLAARTLILVAERDLEEFATLLQRIEPNSELLRTLARWDFCPNSDVASIIIANLNDDVKERQSLRAMVRGWSMTESAGNFVATIMEMVNNGTLNVEDIVYALTRNPPAWAAINARIAEDLGGNPRLWAEFLRQADHAGESSLPDLLARTLANSNEHA